ncbi:MAG: DUF4363 family protein [Oscillospiraceae bacterium]|nr:DUF4363 family protein [Oscillospiraceae bacterium]
MKRFWIGLALLAGILIAGLWTASRLGTLHTGICRTLEQAASAAGDGRWEQADALAAQAQSRWQAGWHFSATLADHTALDEIDSLFAQAEVYRQSRCAADYAATCARLSRLIDALQEGHRLSWWNLL